jgi:hypothetical protein
MNRQTSIFIRRVSLTWLAAAALLIGTPAFAQNTTGTTRPDLGHFRIISERNIFNPNRLARSNNRPPERERERGPEVRSESLSLVGTMSYEKGRFAVFDGSRSEFKKVVHLTGSIAGYTVADIAPGKVKLESTNAQPIELRVGMQLKRREGDDWEVTAAPMAIQQSSTSSSNSSGSSGAASAEESEILKKLMQQREQELSK